MSDTTQEEHPNPERWWRHRRWQAYASLLGVIALGAVAVFGMVPEGSAPVVQSAIWALTAIVAVYSGGACVVDAVAKLRR